MKINLSFLKEPSVVVWCRTKEEADILLDNMVIADHTVYSQLEYKVGKFNLEKDEEGLGFRFELHNGRREVGYGNMYYYRQMNYKIIEFNEIVSAKDLGAINTGYINQNAAIAALF